MKKTFYVFFSQYDWEPEGEIQFLHCKLPEDNNRIFIREIELDVPEIAMQTIDQIARCKVTALEKERQTILAETHQRVSIIDEKIRQLSAITYQEEL